MINYFTPKLKGVIARFFHGGTIALSLSIGLLVLLARNALVVAAPTDSAMIVIPVKTNDSRASIKCEATIHAGTIDRGQLYDGKEDGRGDNIDPSNLNDTQDYKATVQFANDYNSSYELKNKVVVIQFTGAEDTANNDECDNSLELLQSAGSKNIFYGTWKQVPEFTGGSYWPLEIIKAELHEDTGSISFASTGRVKGPDGKTLSFDIKLQDPDNILGTAITSPGAGNVDVGPCSGSATIYEYMGCIEALEPHFEDFATIKYNNETYTAENWGGTDINYYLSASDNPERKTNNIDRAAYRPFFKFHVGSNDNGFDLTVDGDNAYKGVFDTLNKLNSSTLNSSDSATLKYTDYDYSGNKGVDNSGNTVNDKDIEVKKAHNLAIVAGYYKGTGNVQTLITDGGSSELRFLGAYTSESDNKLVYKMPASDKCQTNRTNFTFASDPSSADDGELISVSWNYLEQDNCQPEASATIKVRVTGGNSPTPAVTAVQEVAASCESETGWVGWIACPVIRGLSGAIEWVDNTVSSALQADIPTSERDSLKQVWSNLRNIAYAILVPIMLIMVISSALNLGPFDAYSIKKSLPRMVIAVMFIALSWNICLTIIDIINSIGIGVRGIIETPFNGGDPITLASVFGASFSTAVEGILVLPVIATAIFFLIMSFTTVLLFLMLAFMILVLRRIFIIALFLAAPLAILSWVFPKNNKIWNSWWSSFSKLLLVYPMIMALISMGHVFAWILNQGNDGSVFNFIFKILAYIMPLAFIPAAFKLAGGAFATITGAFNDRSRGLFDRARKGRQERFKRAGERALGAKYIKGGNERNYRGKLNRRIQKLAHLNRAFDEGVFRPGRYKSAMASAIQGRERKERKHIMEDEELDTAALHDDVSGLGGAVFSAHEEGIRRRLMKNGVGTTGADGKVVRDENGNIVVQDKAKLDAAVGRVMQKLNRGDVSGALRQSLIEAGTYKDGDPRLDIDVSHMMRAQRKYGDEVLSQVLVKKAAAGGTYYDNAEDVFDAARAATKNDHNARTDMAATLRGILVNAGRADQGGGAFGATFNLMQDLDDLPAAAVNINKRRASNGQSAISFSSEQEIRDYLQQEYQEHVIDNSPDSVLFHYSMKEGYVDNNVLTAMRRRLKEAAENYYATKDQLAPAAGSGETQADFDAKKAKAKDRYMQLLARTDALYTQQQATKATAAQKIKETVLSAGLIGEGGKATTFSEETYEHKHDPVWRQWHREWTRQNEAEMAEQQPIPGAPGAGAGGQPGAPIGREL